MLQLEEVFFYDLVALLMEKQYVTTILSQGYKYWNSKHS